MEYRLKRIDAASLIFEVGGSKEIRVEYKNSHNLQIEPQDLVNAFPTHAERAAYLRNLDRATRLTLDNIKDKIRNSF